MILFERKGVAYETHALARNSLFFKSRVANGGSGVFLKAYLLTLWVAVFRSPSMRTSPAFGVNRELVGPHENSQRVVVVQNW